jgi:hypothetical protein
METEQRHLFKFFVEEGMKGVEIVDKLNEHYGGDALQRTQVYHWIKDVKSGRKDLSKVPPRGSVPDKGLDDCIAQALREDLHHSTRRIANAFSISSTTLRNDLTNLWG